MIDRNKVVVPADIVARAKRFGHSPERLARLWLIGEDMRAVRTAAGEDPPPDFWAMYRDMPEDALPLLFMGDAPAP
jgi:hypothetical protein